MWIKMGQTWAGMFEFLEASSTLDADTDYAAVSTNDVVADTHANVSSLEVRIPTYMVIQRLRGCTLSNTSGPMGRNLQTWMLHGM